LTILIIIRFVILIFMCIHLTATDLYISYGDWWHWAKLFVMAIYSSVLNKRSVQLPVAWPTLEKTTKDDEIKSAEKTERQRNTCIQS